MRKLMTFTAFLLLHAQAATPDDTLVVQFATDEIVLSLDPAQAYDSGSLQVVENLYETLLQYKGASVREFEPLLATSYRTSNNNRTYTFTLRQNVKFHGGGTMTCADAEYTFRRVLVVNNAEMPAWFLAESLLGTLGNANDDRSVTWDKIANAVRCNRDGQLVFTLPKADPTFVAKLVFPSFGIVSRDYAAKLGEWDGTERTWKAWVGKNLAGSALDRQPNGTGAYQLVRRDATVILARAFDGYWGKAPALRNIVLQGVPENASRLEAMRRGDADIIDFGPRANLSQLRGVPGVVIIDDLPTADVTVLSMNQNIKDPELLGSGKLDGKGIPANFFGDVNVRRAFSFAFAYDDYIRENFLGKATRRTMALPDTFAGYDPTARIYKTDLQQAANYFKRAFGGELWKNGFTLTVNYISNSPGNQKALEMLKRNVESINPKFRINIQGKSGARMYEDALKGRETFAIVGWFPDYAHPDNFMYTFYHPEGHLGSRFGYNDKNVTAWLEQSRATSDTALRNQMYRLIANRAYENPPFILWPAGVRYLVVRDNVRGVSKETFNPMVTFTTGTNWREISKR